MYAMESPVNVEQLKNRQVIAESLMDDYKKHFYAMHTHLDKREILHTYGTHIQTTKDLRKKLECNSFKWYLDEVYYDKKEPKADSQFAGLVCTAAMHPVYMIADVEGIAYLIPCMHAVIISIFYKVWHIH